MDREDRKRRKAEVMRGFEKVRSLLNQWDPLCVEPGRMAPVDEYDGYVFELVSRIEGGCSLDDLYRHLVRLREDVFGMGPGARDDLLFAGQLLSVFRSGGGLRYRIEDELHSELCGDFDSLGEAVSELERLAILPWDVAPNLAPCQGWLTCGRSYEVVQYVARSESCRVLSRTLLLEVDSKGVRWISASDVGGSLDGSGGSVDPQ